MQQLGAAGPRCPRPARSWATLLPRTLRHASTHALSPSSSSSAPSRSLEAAIFLFSRVARIPEGSLVLPAILTEEHITLGAELQDGSLIVGQNNISHPSATGGQPAHVQQRPRRLLLLLLLACKGVLMLRRHLPAIHAARTFGCAGNPREVDKSCEEALAAPIKRIFYLSAEGDTHEHEVAPAPNPRALAELERADAILYGMGSLYTSIVPSLVLKGVGECIAAATAPKVRRLQGKGAGGAATWHAARPLHRPLARPLHRPLGPAARAGKPGQAIVGSRVPLPADSLAQRCDRP